ncbi:MAG: hypothetical protein NC094_11880 [Bacteroidales bacterium]|nr:hypothetical protein [Lachnoclostridium sp.]MCM1385207.1 hypothetical protein [Lachnoclostridium sp.]MCM1466108.1 hypothetical protein [Bacteroidales bacterium]
MRITNKIIQRNNLQNINTNKIYQDKLSTQMSTQKKINRPSDDPVVAIRALRLRSNVTEVTQYYTKNIPDANSWLEITESALQNMSDIVTEMIKQCTKGANGTWKTEDRQTILEQLKALGDEVYSTADADFAGRYVFTGYRTDTSVRFPEKTQKEYTITEQVHKDAIDQITKLEVGDLVNWNTGNYNTGDIATITDDDISALEVYRLRLSYNNCDVPVEGNPPALVAPTITYGRSSADATPLEITPVKVAYSYGGVRVEANGDITAGPDIPIDPSDPDCTNPYKYVNDNPDATVYLADTGELLLGKNVRQTLVDVRDDVSTAYDESEIRITYKKSDWAKGDLRPEHYFHCVQAATAASEEIEYNADYLTGNPEKQVIEYDVGFNQTIRINSTADECFNHGIGREVNDVINALQEALDMEGILANIDKMLNDPPAGADITVLRKQKDAAEKAFTLAKDKCQSMFESGITAFQGYLNDTSLSITNCGTRSKKLELIDTRMQNQKTTFETLKSENEDIDIADTIINLTSAGMTYEAALMATGKVVQNTLLNFI